ncbi:hypothetical protein P9112_014665 [Eukaryota sp. TZLM1-RC]
MDTKSKSQQCAEELAALFSPGFTSTSLLQVIEQGALSKCSVRSVVWMYFLEVFSHPDSPEKWNLDAARDDYYTQRRTIIVKDPSLDAGDPLSTSPDCEGLWEKHFRNQRILSLIRKDLNRLHFTNDILERPEVKEALEEILLLFAISTSDDLESEHCNYRQGMHELVACLLWVRFDNAVNEGSDWKGSKDRPISSQHWAPIASHLLDINHFAADAYLMFSKLMEYMLPWFINSKETTSSSDDFLNLDPLEVLKNSKKKEEIGGAVNSAAMQTMSVLGKRNPAIVAHLEQSDIPPHLFLIPWLRLLFLRQFHLQDCLKLWDVIIAYTPIVIVPYIASAMIEYLSADLIAMGYNQILRRLMSFPPVEDPFTFALHALDVRFPNRACKKKLKKPVEPVSAVPVVIPKQQQQPSSKVKRLDSCLFYLIETVAGSEDGRVAVENVQKVIDELRLLRDELAR